MHIYGEFLIISLINGITRNKMVSAQVSLDSPVPWKQLCFHSKIRMQIASRAVNADGQGPDGCLTLSLDQGVLQNTASRVGHAKRWDRSISFLSPKIRGKGAFCEVSFYALPWGSLCSSAHLGREGKDKKFEIFPLPSAIATHWVSYRWEIFTPWSTGLGVQGSDCTLCGQPKTVTIQHDPGWNNATAPAAARGFCLLKYTAIRASIRTALKYHLRSLCFKEKNDYEKKKSHCQIRRGEEFQSLYNISVAQAFRR